MTHKTSEPQQLQGFNKSSCQQKQKQLVALKTLPQNGNKEQLEPQAFRPHCVPLLFSREIQLMKLNLRQMKSSGVQRSFYTNFEYSQPLSFPLPVYAKTLPPSPIPPSSSYPSRIQDSSLNGSREISRFLMKSKASGAENHSNQ